MLASVAIPHAPETTMPAPENLTTQTPGAPLTEQPSAETITQSSAGAAAPETTIPAAPVFTAKHNGGGRYIVVDAEGLKVGDFTGDKTSAEKEALRLAGGGEPFDASSVNRQPIQAAPKAAAARKIDPTTLKQAVMTPEGWLCPEPKQGA